ncbi:MAG: DUF2382 domain-containing protein [Actinomycetota bacterium]|nr:DUF2382 domain-containing protein [Actinomycetota bacterium]
MASATSRPAALVVSRRTVVRERVIVRKTTEIEEHLIEAELRKERVELEEDRDRRS